MFQFEVTSRPTGNYYRDFPTSTPIRLILSFKFVSMKSLGFIITCLFLGAVLTAQGDFRVDWAKTFGKGSDDTAEYLLEDWEGNILVAGTTTPKGSKTTDIDLLKLSPSGKLIWGKKYDKPGNEKPKGIVQAHDGGYLLLVNSVPCRGGRAHIGIVKLTVEGKIEWSDKFDHSTELNAESIALTRDGGYVVLGNTRNIQSDAVVIKWDMFGNLKWSRFIAHKKDDRGKKIVELANGDLAFVGKTNSMGYGGYDFWFVKMNAAGKIKMENTYGQYRDEAARDVVVTRGGDFILIGDAQQNQSNRDIWVLKINNRGHRAWQKHFYSTNDDRGNSIIEIQGGFLLGGYVQRAGEGKKLWLGKMDKTGKTLWEYEFKGRNHPKFDFTTESTEANHLFMTRDGGIVVASNTGLFLMNKLVVKFWKKMDGYPENDNAEISFRNENIQYGNDQENEISAKSIPAEPEPVEYKKPEKDHEDISQTVFVSEVDLNIPRTGQERKNVFALIIGNEDYTTFQPTLQSEVNVDYAENDARTFYEYCMHTLGIPEKNITLLVNATYGQMVQAISKLQKLAEVSGGEGEVLFYYAGHGMPEEESKEAYLIPVDISGANPESGIKLTDLYAKLSEHKTRRVTVFLDACFSGAGRNQGLLAMRGIKIRPKKSEPIKGNMVVFSSSTGTESSGPLHREGHGLFTYFLLKKLQETQGNCSYGDLSNYLSAKIPLESILENDKEQNPQVQVSKEAKVLWEDWNF